LDGLLPGLTNALKLIQPIKDKYPGITYADLFQLASATAIEVSAFSLLKYLTWSF
jgi:L-ascorbate peroxidase